jgi:hypothetical protein
MIKSKGVFTVEHYRKGKLLDQFTIPNGQTVEGLNKFLDVMFHGTTAIGTWYLGLIDSASYSALSENDTMGSHAGWIEAVAYDEATRPAWTEGAASSKSMTNASAVVFTINATKTIKGIFVTSGSAKSGTTGTLFATSLFTAERAVLDDDTLSITYTVTLS